MPVKITPFPCHPEPQKVQFIHLETEVLRRSLYKGTQSTSPHSLPVDAATAMGILLVLGTILPANSLSAEGVQASKTLLNALEEHSKLHELSCILPSGREMVLESNKDGLFSIADLKSIFKKLDVPFARLLEEITVDPQTSIKFYFYDLSQKQKDSQGGLRRHTDNIANYL